jgi:predicted ABC-type ATPase
MPELHVVAGPNGIGKTTIFKDIVPQGLEYLNADLIVKTIREKTLGLNAQDIANQEAAKIFYQKAANYESFAIETNLCDIDTYKSFQELQTNGYQICIYFISTDDLSICLDRVNLRVKQGGHFVHPEVIQQRYTTGLALLKYYKNFPDILLLLDNSDGLMKTELELRRGIPHGSYNTSKKWVTEIIVEKPIKEDVKSKESIEEVRKMYRRGRGL